MAEEKVIEGLIGFGLTKDEAEAYLFLLKAGACPAGVAARKLRINRMKAYRLLKDLEEKGLVEMIVGRPAKFQSVPLREVLDQQLGEIKAKASRLDKSEKEILEYWEKAHSKVETSEEPRFRILQGRRQVYDFLLQTFEGAKKEISLITTKNDLQRFSFFGLDDELMRLRRENVRVRVLTQVDQYGLELVKRYLDFSEIRHFSLPTSMRFIVVDESEVLNTFAMDDSMSLSTREDLGLWTDGLDYVKAMKAFFDTLWSVSQDARVVMEALRYGRAPQEMRTLSTEEEYEKIFKAMMDSSNEEAVVIESQIGRLPVTLEELRKISGRGARIRLLSKVDLGNLPEIGRILGSAQVMHNPSAVDLQLLIVDRREMLLHIPYLEAMGQAVWSNMKVAVDTMIQIFENYWRESVPAKEILEKFSAQEVLIAGLELGQKSLNAAGWIVDVPGELVDKSGKKRSFSMVAKRTDLPVSPLVLDLLTEEDALGPVVSLNAKTKDAEPVLKLLASTRPFYKEEARLADLYGIKLIYAIEAQELAANIAKEANQISRR
ncbi:MAG: TrmB family transcriptional regulator [Candidatus Bathyarchaeia archaeon]